MEYIFLHWQGHHQVMQENRRLLKYNFLRWQGLNLSLLERCRLV
jgi:hypothetical protein